MFSLKLAKGRIQAPFKAQVRLVSMLSQLKPSYRSTKSEKRLGRGPSSGHGKTSGRGQKGQKARESVKPWFEGGQTPIVKLFPKIGFRAMTSLELTELNLKRIQTFYNEGKLKLEKGEVLTMRKMKEFGLVTGNIKDGIKILGDGKKYFSVPNLKVEATKASLDAIAALEANGGSFTARYFNKLGLKAHLVPNWFLTKYGRLPLQARPTKKKDIEYYSKGNGYLPKVYPEFLELRNNYASQSKVYTKKLTRLEEQLAEAKKVGAQTVKPNFSSVVSVNEL